MTTWGRRKDNKQAYPKTQKKGISGLTVETKTGDIIIKESSNFTNTHKKTNGFIHKNNLKIDIYDSKSHTDNHVDPKFVSEVRRAWNESPDEIRDMVKRIVIKKVSSDNYGFVGRWNHKTKTLTMINLPNSNLDLVSANTAHELDHVWYTEKQKNNDPKVIEYQAKIDLIKPITSYAKEYFDIWDQDRFISRKNADYFRTHKKEKEDHKRRTEFNRNEYYNEQHSETAFILDLLMKGYDNRLVNIDQDNAAKAISFYLELHEDRIKPFMEKYNK